MQRLALGHRIGNLLEVGRRVVAGAVVEIVAAAAAVAGFDGADAESGARTGAVDRVPTLPQPASVIASNTAIARRGVRREA